MTTIDPRLTAFIGRCDAVAKAQQWKRSTLSTKLFNDGKRLDEIASGRSDVGIGRLALAERALSVMEGEAGRRVGR